MSKDTPPGPALCAAAHALWGQPTPGEWTPQQRATRTPPTIAPTVAPVTDDELLAQADATMARLMGAIDTLAGGDALAMVQLRDIDDTTKQCERVRARIQQRLRTRSRNKARGADRSKA